MGPICLRTKNIDSQLSFYKNDLGLHEIRTNADYISLGTGPASASEPIVILHQDEKAWNPPSDATGLYHYALRVPSRRALAEAYLSLGNKGVVFDGYADHQVSEALYLSDPDRNGIEIYSDRPRDEWKFDEGGVVMTTQPLDLDSLVNEIAPEARAASKGIAEGTRVGHVHLKVSNLQASIAFYRDGLGLELMRYWGTAAFLSVGGYHHHVGLNTWESLEGPRANRNWTGLEYFTFSIPEPKLEEMASMLDVRPLGEGTSQKQVFAYDPDDICLLFKTTQNA